MIMQNTTFYIPVKSSNSFIEHLKKDYLSILDNLGYKGRYSFRRLIVPEGFPIDEDTYAVSVLFDSKEDAEKWVDDYVVDILKKLHHQFGKPGNPMFFITYMEDVE